MESLPASVLVIIGIVLFALVIALIIYMRSGGDDAKRDRLERARARLELLQKDLEGQ
jgi:hypothetical protein